MMLAGYVGYSESVARAGFVTVPGGLLILVALAVARRADLSEHRSRASRTNHLAGRAAVMVATMLSGGVMVLAGYAAAAWGRGLALALATVGGAVIATAFVLDRRS